MINSNVDVIYREVAGRIGYRIGSDGSAWSRWAKGPRSSAVLGDRWRRLKPWLNKTIVYVQMGVGTAPSLAHLVLTAFVGPKPAGMHACHFPDRDPWNCSLTNLRWDTPKEKAQDQIRHGTKAGGEHNGNAKLSNDQVAELFRLRGTKTQRQLAVEFGISETHLSRIYHGSNRTPSAHAGRGIA
jgi:hypothetical protein